MAAHFRVAGQIADKALKAVREAAKEGATLWELCQLGDKVMADDLSALAPLDVAKGIAFPTCVNPNNIPAHMSPPTPEDESNLTLAHGDVVNFMLGAQVDGFPAVVGETFIVGESVESPVTGAKADLMHAAWNASEAAIRTLTKGRRTYGVTAVVDKVAKNFGTSAVQSMISNTFEKNVLYGAKEIILNPTKEHKNQTSTYEFEQNDVWGLDILISTSADGKVRNSNYKTSLYKLTGSKYALKLRTSQQALRLFKPKAADMFPVNIKNFEDPKKMRLGLIECSRHHVTLPYDIMEGKPGDYIAQFFTTVAIGPNGLVKYTHPSFDGSLYTTDKKVEDEELQQLLAMPLHEPATI